MDCDQLQQIAHSVSLVRECDVVRSGALRMATPFLYPDGSNVDIFLESRRTEFWETYVLSDFGQTGLHLHEAQIKIDSTSRKREIVTDICSKLGVFFRAGSLEIDLSGSAPTDISDALVRLSQACIRISDFAYHQRLRSKNPFRDDIEGFFDASNFDYEANVAVPVANRNVKIDFEVAAEGHESFVLILSALSEPSAHNAANEMFAKWFDLRSSGLYESHQFVSVYNSQSAVFRGADMERLKTYSSVVGYPAEEEILSGAIRTGRIQ